MAMTLQQMFRRYRKPGDIVFAIALLGFALFLLYHLTSETRWLDGKALFAQPRFWPAIGVIGMVGFAALHLAGSVASPRIPGRLRELALWARACEYALWFLAYVVAVPVAGYLSATLAFTVLLTLRVGYRGRRWVLAAVVAALIIVVVFRTLLQVRMPGGAWYDALPDGLRRLMLSHF